MIVAAGFDFQICNGFVPASFAHPGVLNDEILTPRGFANKQGMMKIMHWHAM